MCYEARKGEQTGLIGPVVLGVWHYQVTDDAAGATKQIELRL